MPEIGRNYPDRLIYNFPHVSSKFSQNFGRFVNFLKIADFYFLILFPKCGKKFLRILYFEVFLKFHKNFHRILEYIQIFSRIFLSQISWKIFRLVQICHYAKPTVPHTDPLVRVLFVHVYQVGLYGRLQEYALEK